MMACTHHQYLIKNIHKSTTLKNYGWDGYCKYDGRAVGMASWLQAEAMTIGTKVGNGKYICQIEHDCLFF